MGAAAKKFTAASRAAACPGAEKVERGLHIANRKEPMRAELELRTYQLLKSGTSIGANYREANRAQSHDDFIHKIAICEKEAAETEYWLELLIESGVANPGTCDDLLREAPELLAIFVASGRTAKSRR